MKAVLGATFVAIVSFASDVSAQTRAAIVRGIVIDAEAAAPLAFATVRILELHRGFQTHEDGAFVFSNVVPGTYTIIAHRIGYAPREVKVTVQPGVDTTIRLAMEPRPVELQRTVITGTISERNAADLISATSVLAGAELDRVLDGTLAGTVSGQAGVSATSMGPATAKPVLRGLSGDRVLVLEDGARSGDMSSAGADHAITVDPLTISRVEVVRGPMSLLYGSSALGGVINAVREEVPTSRLDRLHGTLAVQGGTASRGVGVAGEARLPLGPIGLRAEASARTSGDLRTPGGRLANTGVATYGVALGASRVGNQGHVGASYRGYFNTYGLPGGFVGAHPGGVDITMRRHAFRVVADWHREGRVVRTVRAATNASLYGHEEITGRGSIGTSFDQTVVAAEMTVDFAPRGRLANGAFGVRAQYRDIATGGSLRTPDTHDWTTGAFAVGELSLGRLAVQGGLRADVARYEPREAGVVSVRGEQIPTAPRTFHALTGAVGTLWDAGGGLRTGFNVSRAFRTPDFNELYSDGPHLAAYSYDVGNPRLGAETGVGIDAFARLVRGRWRGELALFHSRFANYIFPRNTGELGRQGERWKFQYSGRDATLSGAETQFSIALAGSVAFDASASLVIGRILGERDSIPAVGGEPARLSSSYLPTIPHCMAVLECDGIALGGSLAPACGWRPDKPAQAISKLPRPPLGWSTSAWACGALPTAASTR